MSGISHHTVPSPGPADQKQYFLFSQVLTHHPFSPAGPPPHCDVSGARCRPSGEAGKKLQPRLLIDFLCCVQVFMLKPGLSLRSTYLAQFLLLLHRKALTLLKYIEDDT